MVARNNILVATGTFNVRAAKCFEARYMATEYHVTCVLYFTIFCFTAINFQSVLLLCLQVSGKLQGFLDMMLVRDPAKRATAYELLSHPFMMQHVNPQCLLPLMNNIQYR